MKKIIQISVFFVIISLIGAVNIYAEMTSREANSQGHAFMDQRKYDEAIVSYSKAIELNPKSASSYFNRGNAYLAKDEYLRALNDLNESISLDPKLSDQVYWKRAVISIILKSPKTALVDLTSAINMNPNDANYYDFRGGIYWTIGEKQKAIDDMRKACNLNLKRSCERLDNWFK